MTDDLLERLDAFGAEWHPSPSDLFLFAEAAARIRTLTADLAEARAALARAEKKIAGLEVDRIDPDRALKIALFANHNAGRTRADYGGVLVDMATGDRAWCTFDVVGPVESDRRARAQLAVPHPAPEAQQAVVPEAGAWQPIATAPLDTWFLARDPDGSLYRARIHRDDEDDWYEVMCGQWVTERSEPSHWMPEPTAPSGSEAQGGESDA